MSINTIVAIVVILAIQSYYVITETAMTARTTQGTNSPADRGTRKIVWVLIALAFAGAWPPVIFGFGRLFLLGDWLTWVGVAIMIGAVIFRRYVIFYLGKFFTATVQIRQDHQLIKTGPYRYIRHPSYLGILLLVIGDGIALGNWISLVLCIALPLTGIIRRISVEEKELYQHFGEQYSEYRKITWRMIPYIY